MAQETLIRRTVDLLPNLRVLDAISLATWAVGQALTKSFKE